MKDRTNRNTLFFVSWPQSLFLIIATIPSLKVLAEAQKELLNYGNLGISVMGMLNYKNVVKICQCASSHKRNNYVGRRNINLDHF